MGLRPFIQILNGIAAGVSSLAELGTPSPVEPPFAFCFSAVPRIQNAGPDRQRPDVRPAKAVILETSS
jgi:hypothetical protein